MHLIEGEKNSIPVLLFRNEYVNFSSGSLNLVLIAPPFKSVPHKTRRVVGNNYCHFRYPKHQIRTIYLFSEQVARLFSMNSSVDIC